MAKEAKAKTLTAEEPEAKEPVRGLVLPELTDEQVAVALAEGYVSVDLAEPVRVLIGKGNKLANIVRLERQELAPGKKDGIKAPGETRYICVRDDDPSGAESTMLASDINTVLR